VLAMASALARHSMHPVSVALAAAGDAVNPEALWICDAVTETAGQGVTGKVSPAGHAAAYAKPLNTLRLGSAAFCGVSATRSENLQAFLSDADGWLATFELQEDVRPEARDAVRALAEEGIDVHMLSGDNAASVVRVAGQVGIENATGGCSPADKLAALRDLQASGKTVAMVGDGLNDGPVFAGAHVSFAFGRAVPLAQGQSDFVVMGETLESVVQTLRLARSTMRVVHQNLGWALAYNAACVPLAVMGWLPAWLAGLGMAGSSLVVVLNALRLARDLPGMNPRFQQEV
jgi:P-type Cu2+ transporter